MKKINLNFFCVGICVKIINDFIMINVVRYNDISDHKKVIETRLPGGTIQFQDIIIGIKNIQNRIGLRADSVEYLYDLINEVAESFDSKISEMPSETNAEKIEIRKIFVASLNSIGEAIENFPGVNDSKISIIENAIKDATLRRELRFECNVTEFDSAAQCGFVKRGEHVQYPFLVLGSDAPDEYSGSADEDIESSYFESLSNLNSTLYPAHKVFLSNAINLFVQIYERDEKVAFIVSQARNFLKPAN